MFLSYVRGSVTLGDQTVIQVAAGLTAGRQIAGTAALSADAQMTLVPDPFSLALEGTVKVFIVQVGGAKAKLTSSSFTATLWVKLAIIQGNVKFGAVDSYYLLTPPKLAQMRAAWTARANGEVLSAAASDLLQGIDLAPARTTINVPINGGNSVIFAFGITGLAPDLTLITPDGQRLNPQQLPANIQYQQVPGYRAGKAVSAGVARLVRSAGVVQAAEAAQISAADQQEYAQIVALIGNDPARLTEAIGVVSLLSTDTLTASAQLRVVNSRYQGSAVDLYLDGQPFFTNLPAAADENLNFISHYGQIPTGNHTVKVTAAGNGNAVLLETTVNVAAGQVASLVLLEQNGGLASQLLNDRAEAAPVGQVALRFVQLGAPTRQLAVREGANLLFSNIGYGQSSAYVLPFMPLPKDLMNSVVNVAPTRRATSSRKTSLDTLSLVDL